MRLLLIDTASDHLGVALGTPEGLLVRKLALSRGAETVLVPWVQELVQESGAELEAVAAVDGPGTFTGLRVGLVTAAALAFARRLPFWTCDSLLPRGAAVGRVDRGSVWLDAKKGRVYADLWEGGRRVSPPADVSPAEALSWAPSWVAGAGALAYAAQAREAGVLVLPESDEVLAALYGLAERAFRAGEGGPPRVVPRYLRAPDAVMTRERSKGEG